MAETTWQSIPVHMIRIYWKCRICPRELWTSVQSHEPACCTYLMNRLDVKVATHLLTEEIKPSSGMTFAECIPYLIEGKSIRRDCWAPKAYVHSDGDNWFEHYYGDGPARIFQLKVEHLQANDWEVVP